VSEKEFPYPLSSKEHEALRREAERELEQRANLLKVVSEPVRLRILSILREKEVCVCVLVSLLKMKHSTLSYHLKLLKRAGLVESSREGGFQVYSLTSEGRFLIEFVMRML